jgi:hypothetical protein
MPKTKGAKDKKPKSPLTGTLEEKFWEYTIELPNGCIQWIAGIDDSCYGEFNVAPGKIVCAHSYAWELDRGCIPEGLRVEHLCHNRGCVNVNHMQLASIAENLEPEVHFGDLWGLPEYEVTANYNREYIKYAG